MSEQIARISRMENLLNESVAAVEALDRALEEYQAVQDKISQLRQYYDDGDWMEDFNADCAGKLPDDLPRGCSYGGCNLRPVDRPSTSARGIYRTE